MHGDYTTPVTTKDFRSFKAAENFARKWGMKEGGDYDPELTWNGAANKLLGNKEKNDMKKRIRLTEPNESTPSDIAYGLMVMLGEIQNELMKGGDQVTIDEIGELYGMAIELNDYFEGLTAKH